MLFGFLLLAHALHGVPVSADGTLRAAPALETAAAQQWEALARQYAQWTDHAAPPLVRTLVLSRDPAPLPGHAGRSALGRVWLRQAADEGVAAATLQTLRHELAHQFLWHVCPAASGDRLFHEAWAVAVSGELDAWIEAGRYVSAPEALRALQRAPSLNLPGSRAALARLLMDGTGPAGALPDPLLRRLRLCSVDALPRAPMVPEDLSAEVPADDAWVVLSRHSGAVLEEQGASRAAMPFGSTLKPFLLAGTPGPPLPPQPQRPEWQCKQAAGPWMAPGAALVLSCNGYFLDWGAQQPQAAQFGAFGPLLVRLGLGRLPRHMSEAMGLGTSLRLSPFELAQGYRVLAEASPELLRTLQDTTTQGTLRGLPAAARLGGWAVKTGTVRDAQGRAVLGWLVAVDADRVAVMARRGRVPRKMVPDLLLALRLGGRTGPAAGSALGPRAPGGSGMDADARGPATVQVLGKLPLQTVQARCPGIAVSIAYATPSLAPAQEPLGVAARRGMALCLGAPWWIQSPDLRPAAPEGRPYAGIFSWGAAGGVVFRTSLRDYAAGVLAREDASLRGSARQALARVIAHNARHSRHGAQPVCDTTHCQVFQGTGRTRLTDLDLRPLPTTEWLLFSQGGRAPWHTERPRAAVEALFGGQIASVAFGDKMARARLLRQSDDALYEVGQALPCEVLRGALRLLSCPQRAQLRDDAVRFEGIGEGHGLGLDVEWAKTSHLSADAILRNAYGEALRL